MRSRPSGRSTRPRSKARLALELFLGTGAACQDAAAMTRANIRGPRLSYRRGKTGQEVDLPILPELAKELAHLPRDQMMLLAHGTQGKGYTAGSLSNVFRDMCAEAGLNHCSAHGLRKAAPVAWPSMARPNGRSWPSSRTAPRRRRAATRRLQTGPNSQPRAWRSWGRITNKYCPTFPKGWTKGGSKLMKYNGNMERVVTPTGIEPVSPP